MIGVIATCDVHRINLLRPFIHHYRQYSIKDFYLSIHVPPEASDCFTQRIVGLAERELGIVGVSLEGVVRKPFDAIMLREYHDSIQRRVGPRYDAIIWADIDEFHELPKPLFPFVKLMLQQGYSALRGQFVDRVARSGSLPLFCSKTSVWSQFPLGADITGRVLGGSVHKVILARPDIGISRGNHGIVPDQDVKWWPTRFPVHHFKWDETVVTRLKERLTEDWKRRCSWWRQSDAGINWLASSGDRIDLNEVGVYDFEDDCGSNVGPYGNNPLYLGKSYW